MSNKLLTRLFIVMAIAVAGIFVLESSLYSVGPGETAVIVQHGEATASTRQPGLHWKPVNAGLVSLDSRVRAAHDIFNADQKSPGTGASAGYAVIWRLNQPLTYYGATQGKEEAAVSQMKEAVDGALRKQLAAPANPAVFAEPAASVDAALAAALKPVAAKLGIAVLAARITSITPAEDARKQIVQSMLQAESQARQAGRDKARDAAARKLAATRAQAHAILAAARQQAASIKGEGEARVAGIYAKASSAAPGFFRFYQTLLSEQAALTTHTRLYILSTDSPWFKLLGTAPGKSGKR